MSDNKGNNFMNIDELRKAYLSFQGNTFDLWNIEKKSLLKLKSIQDIETSTTQVDKENKRLEIRLHYTKLRIEEVRDSIICFDRMNSSLHEILAHLDVQHKNKEFSIKKSRNDFELQIFIRKELYQREEGRLKNSIPEIKELRLAECELETTKIEYDELIITQENLIKKIAKTQEENDNNLYDIVVKFAKKFIEMTFLNKREDNCHALLRKLDAEYEEKLKTKNSLLEIKKNKVNTVPFLTNTLCQFDLKMMDMNFKLLNQGLKPHFTVFHTNLDLSDKQKIDIGNSKFKSTKKTVRFLLPFEEKILGTDIDTSNIRRNTNYNLVESNTTNINEMCTGSSVIKDASEDNISSNLFPRNVLTESKNEKKDLMNEYNLDHQTKRPLVTDIKSDFKIKNPYNPVQNNIHKDQNIISSKTIQPSVRNKNIYMEKHVIENQERNELVDKSIDNCNNKESNNGYTCQLQENQDFQLSGPSHSSPIFDISLFEDNIMKFDDSSSRENNQRLYNLFRNDSEEQSPENSLNDSFCDPEIFGDDDDDDVQYKYVQLDFTNTFNRGYSNSMFKSNLQNTKNKNPEQFGNDMFQNLKNQSLKKMSISSNTSKNRTTNKSTDNFTLPIRTNYVSNEEFRFNLD